MIQPNDAEAISRKLQQGLADWNPNPLVPKAFQTPVQSEALNAAITAIAALSGVPLEEALRGQQEQIQTLQAQIQILQKQIQHLEQVIAK